MAISIKSNPDGVSGAIQVNGVDAVTIDTGGITAGVYPDQSGNSGKVLTTNGTNVSWGTQDIMSNNLALAQAQAIALCF